MYFISTKRDNIFDCFASIENINFMNQHDYLNLLKYIAFI